MAARRKQWNGTSPRDIRQTAGRLYGTLAPAICKVERQAKAYEKAHPGQTLTGDLEGWTEATSRTDEALFLKWQEVRRRAAWDAYRRTPQGRQNYGAW